MQGDYIIAKYIRLSMDEAQSDSMSIENQRLLLDKHIADMDINNASVLEFVDNGHTGTNFERPAIQELLELVRQGRINCVLVKDMSRFGRMMIENGYYLERVFPMYRVRFISVCDGFDSTDYEGGTGGIDMALKSLLHEHYSRDLSLKIKSAKRAKMLRGESVRKNCLFGYMLDEKRKMIIDEPAAVTVKLIFKLALEGMSITDIAKQLYKEKRPSPSTHKGLKSNTGYVWIPSQICCMLRDEQYIGTYVAGKVENTAIGSTTTVPVPESEWVKIPNHHPAIIEKDVFFKIQETIAKKAPKRKRNVTTHQRYGRSDSPLKNKAICGCCGHTMRLNHTQNKRFSCVFTLVAPDLECHKLSVDGNELESTVLQTIHSHMQDSFKHSDSQTGNNADCAEIIARIENSKRVLYEKLILSEINASEYRTEKSKLDTEHEQTKQKHGISHKSIENISVNDNFKQDTLNTNKLTRQAVDALIDKVYVYPGNRIEVVWKTPIR